MLFPNVPSGHVPTQSVPERNSKSVFPHLVQISASVVDQATQLELQSSQISPTGSLPSSQTSTQELSCKNKAGVAVRQEFQEDVSEEEQVSQG